MIERDKFEFGHHCATLIHTALRVYSTKGNIVSELTSILTCLVATLLFTEGEDLINIARVHTASKRAGLVDRLDPSKSCIVDALFLLQKDY